MTDQRWRKALHSVPRHVFTPPVAWAAPDDGEGEDRRIDQDADPDDWWNAAYSNAAIITQLDDGATDVDSGQGAYTSSLSATGVVFTFLELLYVHDHHQVLEIGTGTGWTAALLSWRVGAENVTTIELDEQVAAQAAINLKASCYSPRQVVGDGAKGWPEGAPYDRVHVTCGVRDIPYAWVEQTRPGGIIALPWSPGYAFGHRVRLDVMPDGTAMGRFAGSAGYMMLRSQRSPDVTYDGDATETTTRVDPRSVAWDSYGADTAIAGTLPGLFSREDKRDDGSFLLWLEESGGSWASVEYRPHRTLYEVRQAGNRQLWDEVEAAYFRWQSWGRPERSRFGMTVTPDGQRLWLDDPRRVIGAE